MTHADLRNEAVSLMLSGRLYEAIKLWKRLIEDGAFITHAHYNAGVCFYAIHKYEAAALHLGIARDAGHNRAKALLDEVESIIWRRNSD